MRACYHQSSSGRKGKGEEAQKIMANLEKNADMTDFWKPSQAHTPTHAHQKVCKTFFILPVDHLLT
jgi:hypothetical protein